MENQEIVNKVHEAFEATRLAVAGGDLMAAILGITFGTNEGTFIWYEQAGNYCLVHEMCRWQDDRGYDAHEGDFTGFDAYKEMVASKDLIAAVLLYEKRDEISYQSRGPASACRWLLHEAAVRQDVMLKLNFQMQLQKSMMMNAPRVQPAGGIPGPNGGRINLN
jgi:hypothetical protein